MDEALATALPFRIQLTDWLNDLAIGGAVAAAGVVGHLALRKANRRKKNLAGQIQADLWAEYGKSPVAWDEFHG